MEYPLKASPALVYARISTPSGLSQWFADDVDVYNNQYKFKWGNDLQIADVLRKRLNKLIKYKWTDSEADEYFEFEIIIDGITNDVALVVTDFVDESDEANAIQLWESQVQDLRVSLGA